MVQLGRCEELDQGAKCNEDGGDDGVGDVELGDEGDLADGDVGRVDGGGEDRGEGGEEGAGEGEAENLEGDDKVDGKEEDHDGVPRPGVKREERCYQSKGY